MIKVALADDHEIIRNGIKMVLENESQINVIWEASDGQETLDKMNEMQPDVLIVDIRMPMLNGLEVTQKLKQKDPSIKILVLTMHDDSEYIIKSLEYGADGYILKDTNKIEFIKAVKMVNDGQKYYSGDVSTTIVNYLSNPKATLATNQGQSKNDHKDYQLTRRELEILKMIYDGVPNKEIAEVLGKSVRTIETHRFNIMKKVEVNNITELLKKVEREKLV